MVWREGEGKELGETVALGLNKNNGMLKYYSKYHSWLETW